MSLSFGIPTELDIANILTLAGVYIGVTGNRFQYGSGSNSTLMVSDSGAFANLTLLNSTSGVLYAQTAASGTLLYNLIQGISGFDLSTFATTGSLNALSGFVLAVSGFLETSNTSAMVSGSNTLPSANFVGDNTTATVTLSGVGTVVVSALPAVTGQSGYNAQTYATMAGLSSVLDNSLIKAMDNYLYFGAQPNGTSGMAIAGAGNNGTGSFAILTNIYVLNSGDPVSGFGIVGGNASNAFALSCSGLYLWAGQRNVAGFPPIVYTTQLNTGQWYSVGYVRNSVTATAQTGYIYVNGQVVASGIDTKNYGGSYNFIGQLGSITQPPVGVFTGFLNNFAIFTNIPLSTAQVNNFIWYGRDPSLGIQPVIDFTAGIISGNILYSKGANNTNITYAQNVIPITFNDRVVNLALTVSGHGNDNAINLSGQLTSLSGFTTGLSGFDSSTYATIFNLTQSGIIFEGQLASLSGWAASALNLQLTGSALYLDIVGLSGVMGGISGGLQAQIVGGNGTQLKVTGSSTLATTTLTGIGGVTITLAGSTIFVSGAGVGTFDPLGSAANTGQLLYGLLTSSSGQTSIAANEVIFTSGGIFAGSPNLVYNVTGNFLNIGQGVILPWNPLSITSGSTGYTQVTLMNPTTASGASTDWIITADSGNDTRFYLDVGVNSSIYNVVSGMGSGFDGYVYLQGGTGSLAPGRGNLYVGTTSSGTFVFLFAGNVSGQPSAAIDASGINLPNSVYSYRINNVPITSMFNSIGSTLSGGLTNTGAALYAMITGSSGQGYNILNVTMFGAVGNAINNDTFAIQQAINFYQNNNNRFSELYFPALNYYRTGILHVTGSNLRFNGDGRANLIASGVNDFQIINISGDTVGVSGIVWDGINIFGGMTGNANISQSSGCITLTNTVSTTIRNSNIKNTAGVCVLLNGSNYLPTIDSNQFENYYIGVYSQTANLTSIITSTGHPDRVQITNNRFLNGWGGPGYNYGGGIKLQSPLSPASATTGLNLPTGYCRGCLVANNRMNNPGQMGIECWGNIADSVVTNNMIEGAGWGISIANGSMNITVSNNTVQAGSGSAWGIEAADSSNITIVGNTVDGSTGYGSNVLPVQVPGFNGITCNGVWFTPNYYNVLGNTVKNCNSNHIYNIYAQNVNIIGNSIMCSGSGVSPIGFYSLASSFVNFSNNSVNMVTGGFFAFIDASATMSNGQQPNISGITIANNDFNGSVNQQGILLYSATTGSNCNVLIENNRTHNVRYIGLGGMNTPGGSANFVPGQMMVGLTSAGVNTNAAASYTLRNNLGNPSGVGYFIYDAIFPIPTYQLSYQYNTQFTPLATGWYRIISGGYQYVGGTIKLGIGAGNAFDGNSALDEEFHISVPGYGIANGTIDWVRHGQYNGPTVSAVRIGSDGGSTITCDLLLASTGSSPIYVNAFGPMMEPLITAVTSGAKIPNSNVVVMMANNAGGLATTNTLFVSGGATLGSTVSLPGIATAGTASIGSASLPASPVAFMTFTITGVNFKVPYYNV